MMFENSLFLYYARGFALQDCLLCRLLLYLLNLSTPVSINIFAARKRCGLSSSSPLTNYVQPSISHPESMNAHHQCILDEKRHCSHQSPYTRTVLASLKYLLPSDICSQKQLSSAMLAWHDAVDLSLNIRISHSENSSSSFWGEINHPLKVCDHIQTAFHQH